MTTSELYQHICCSPDPEAEVRERTDSQLADLMAYLGAAKSGIPALVLAMAESMAVGRWREDQKYRSGAVGEGDS